MKPKWPKSRFKSGQVVMVENAIGAPAFPVKLIRREDSYRWRDAHGYLHLESRMHPLTARERGGR